MQSYNSKKEAVSKEESRRSLSKNKSSKSNKKVTISTAEESGEERQDHMMPFTVGDVIVPRRVWIKHALLLIQQVTI